MKKLTVVVLAILLTISGCQNGILQQNRYCPGGTCPANGPSPYWPQPENPNQPPFRAI